MALTVGVVGGEVVDGSDTTAPAPASLGADRTRRAWS